MIIDSIWVRNFKICVSFKWLSEVMNEEFEQHSMVAKKKK